jgi:hypothetical protein
LGVLVSSHNCPSARIGLFKLELSHNQHHPSTPIPVVFQLFSARNIFDYKPLSAFVKIEVHDPISPTDQIEIVCPDVVDPGTYFLCKADIPRGTSITANITMTDDVDGKKESTGNLRVPGESPCWVFINSISILLLSSNVNLLC